MVEQGQWVVVRTLGAGVHFGQVTTWGSNEPWIVELAHARRCWRWRSDKSATIYTLHELALHGPGTGSNISEEVSEITLTSVIEIIPMTQDAVLKLRSVGWSG